MAGPAPTRESLVGVVGNAIALCGLAGLLLFLFITTGLFVCLCLQHITDPHIASASLDVTINNPLSQADDVSYVIIGVVGSI